MEQLIRELGEIKRRIRRLQSRSARLTKELQMLRTRREEIENKLGDISITGADLSLSELIQKMVKQPMFPKDILARLEAVSFNFSKVKDPYTLVFATCARLAKNGIIGSNKQDGKRVFFKI